MHLSDAAVLGDSLRTRDPNFYIEKTRRGYCGCAIGGAILAAGGKEVEDYPTLFPWLRERPNKRSWKNYAHIISVKFYEVMNGTITYEALIGYIKSVEPACGDCNRFTCTCVKAAAVEESVLVAHV